MKRGRKATLSATTCALLALSTISYGADTKVYPGAECINEGAFEQSVTYGSDGSITGLFGFGSGIADVVCPIVRDDRPSSPGGRVRVMVRVFVPTPPEPELGAAVFCALVSRNGATGEIVADNFNDERRPGDHVIHLQVDHSVPDGYYHLRCGLGGPATIRSYKVREFR